MPRNDCDKFSKVNSRPRSKSVTKDILMRKGNSVIPVNLEILGYAHLLVLDKEVYFYLISAFFC